jgi:hypothetical protein
MDQAAAVLFGSVVIVTLAMIDATVGAASGVTGAKPQSQILRRGDQTAWLGISDSNCRIRARAM